MSQENVQLIRAMYDAFDVGDVNGVLGRMSADIVWNEAENFPYADGNPYIGPEAVAKGVFARCIGEWDGFRVVVDEIFDAGETVITVGRECGTCKATGNVMNAQMVHVWRIANGKATRFQQYVDTLHVARAIGRA